MYICINIYTSTSAYICADVYIRAIYIRIYIHPDVYTSGHITPDIFMYMYASICMFI